MINSEEYMQHLCDALVKYFGDRLIYVGLQGSYMRGEANEDSDIDPMVVIDNFCLADMDRYKQIISDMESPEKSCGFICGKQDLASWNPLEICHLVHTTKDMRGQLAGLVPNYTQEDVRNYIKMSVNNLYHEITHRYIHSPMEMNAAKIAGTYKGVFFILQNLHYLETGAFIATKLELLQVLSGMDHNVLSTAIALSNGTKIDFYNAFALLHGWCQNVLQRLSIPGDISCTNL